MSIVPDKVQNISTFMKNSSKGMFILIIILLIFFAINLFVNIQGKHESAYSVLSKSSNEAPLMLQDTRVHNWEEIDKNNKSRGK